MLIEDDKELSAEALKNVLLGKSNETRTILEVFQRHNEQMEALVGQEFAPLTLKRYKIFVYFSSDCSWIMQGRFSNVLALTTKENSARGAIFDLKITPLNLLTGRVLVCKQYYQFGFCTSLGFIKISFVGNGSK